MYAACGGVCVTLAIAIAIAIGWLWLVDAVKPARRDSAGAALCIAGMFIIMLQPRAG